jgi:hypothetical protein
MKFLIKPISSIKDPVRTVDLATSRIHGALFDEDPEAGTFLTDLQKTAQVYSKISVITALD